MMHDLQYFRQEIEKVKTRAINRAFSAPPRANVQIVFRADGDPRNANVDRWASLLLHLEHRHRIPLTVSGGGYGCFSFSAETFHGNAEPVMAAIENDPEVQRALNNEAAIDVEIRQHHGNKMSAEAMSPSATYPCIVVTNRRPSNPIQPGALVNFTAFGTEEHNELTAGALDIWVYDPRTSARARGPWERKWRRHPGGPAALSSMLVNYSSIKVRPLAELLEEAGEKSLSIADAPLGEPGALRPPKTQRPRFTVFVHGYNTAMDKAVCAVGRLVHNVRYDQIGAIPIIYCWPSRGAFAAYFSDGERAQGSEVRLSQLLEAVTAPRHGLPIVDVLAHSHGTQLTLRSFITFEPRPEAPVRNMIFVAPDLHNAVFSDYLPRIQKKLTHTTVYFSIGDLALWIASIWKTKRLGAEPEIPSGTAALDLIDASFLRTSGLGHDYHIGCAEMHEDIRGLMDGLTPGRRRLIRKHQEDARMWRLDDIY